MFIFTFLAFAVRKSCLLFRLLFYTDLFTIIHYVMNTSRILKEPMTGGILFEPITGTQTFPGGYSFLGRIYVCYRLRESGPWFLMALLSWAGSPMLVAPLLHRPTLCYLAVPQGTTRIFPTC